MNVGIVNSSVFVPTRSNSTDSSANPKNQNGVERATIDDEALVAENPLARSGDNFADSTRVSNRIPDEATTESANTSVASRDLVYSLDSLQSGSQSRRPPDELTYDVTQASGENLEKSIDIFV